MYTPPPPIHHPHTWYQKSEKGMEDIYWIWIPTVPIYYMVKPPSI